MLEGGGNCLKYIKQKRRGGNKVFKKGGQAGSRGGCLKKGVGAGTPLRTMIKGLHLSPICLTKLPYLFYVAPQLVQLMPKEVVLMGI